jgi:polar amino acid transport system substrate-binding protein
MKKILAFLCALVLVLSLCACSSSTADTTEAAETDTTDTAEVAETAEAAETEEADETAQAEEATLETAVAGTLTMATNAEFPPYESYEGDEVVGIDAEIAAAIAEKLGLELDIQDMAFDSIIPAITSGKADVGLAGMTVTEERQQSVDFSDSYATGVQVIIVTEDSPITCADDLFGDGNYTIGVQNATTGDLYCTWDIEDEGLGTVQRYNKGADAVQALITGKVDCVVIDNEPAKAFVAANEGLTILDTEYVTEDYAIALAKDSSLTESVNTALQELIADGTVQSILDKYIGD